MRRLSAPPLIPTHFAAVAILLLVFAVWPPRSGELLLIPLSVRASGDAAQAAIAGGALLLGRGPFPGSLVVVGDRDRVVRQSGGWDMLVMAAPQAGCRRPRDGGVPA